MSGDARVLRAWKKCLWSGKRMSQGGCWSSCALPLTCTIELSNVCVDCEFLVASHTQKLTGGFDPYREGVPPGE